MATPLTKKQITQLPVISPALQTGDLFFCSGSYFSSYLIQAFTHSPWSHCGLVWIPYESSSPLFLESDKGNGIRVVPMEKYIRPIQGILYDGPVVIARCAGLALCNALQAIQHGLTMLGHPYSLMHIVKAAWHILTHPQPTMEGKWTCSELVSSCLHSAGNGVERKKVYITPGELWQHPSIEMLGRIA